MVAAPQNTTFVIVNYNTGKYLRECLNSLRRQAVQPHAVIVVDNGSTDTETEKICKQFNEIEFIKLPENVGYAAANNVGIKKSRNSHWIAFINPDVVLHEQWLYSILKAARLNKEFVGFGCKLLKGKTPNIVDGIGDVYHTSGMVWRLRHGRRLSQEDDIPREIFSPCTAAALYRKDVLMEVGGFDEDYFCYLEDVDLGFRLRLLGYRFLYVPEAIAYHIGSASTGRNSDFYVYHGHRNIVWTYFKNMPTPLFQAYSLQHLFLNLFSLVWFSTRGQLPVILKAKKDAIRGIPSALRKRREIQKSRRVGAARIWRHLGSGMKGLISRNRVDFS